MALTSPSVHAEVDQGGRGRQVVVPHAVMHQLEVPRSTAAARLDRHQALGEQAMTGSMPAVEVVGRRAERQVDEAQLLVRGHVRPDVGAARVGRRVARPRVGAELALLRDGPEGPQSAPRPDVEAHHVAARPLLVSRTVVDARPHHDDAANHDGRGRHAEIGSALGPRHAGHEIHPPAIAEARGELPGLRIHRDQVGIGRPEQQPLDSCRRSSTPVPGARSPGCRGGRSSSFRDRRSTASARWRDRWRRSGRARSRCRARPAPSTACRDTSLASAAGWRRRAGCRGRPSARPRRAATRCHA